MYYSFIGTFITVIVGTIVGAITKSKNDKFDYKLLHTLVLKCCRRFGYCNDENDNVIGTSIVSTVNIEILTISNDKIK